MIYFKPENISDKQLNNSVKICAYEGDNKIGSCILSVDGYTCRISEISLLDSDALLAEGIIRSALNYAANRGAYIAECSDENSTEVLTYLGFEKCADIFSGEIPELLKGHCCKSADNVD